MTPNELRIGNWVHSPEWGGYDRQIEAHDFEYVEEEKYEPIPLTEEWLERFEFKVYIDFGIRTGLYDKRPLCGFSYDINTQQVMILHKGNGISHWIDIKIEYVHQLQNLYFALTGEELTIKTN